MEYGNGVLSQIMTTSIKLSQCDASDQEIGKRFVATFPKPKAGKVQECFELYGWERQSFPNPKLTVYGKDSYRIAFPSDECGEGFVLGVVTITETLAAIEGISPLLLYKRMC